MNPADNANFCCILKLQEFLNDTLTEEKLAQQYIFLKI